MVFSLKIFLRFPWVLNVEYSLWISFFGILILKNNEDCHSSKTIWKINCFKIMRVRKTKARLWINIDYRVVSNCLCHVRNSIIIFFDSILPQCLYNQKRPVILPIAWVRSWSSLFSKKPRPKFNLESSFPVLALTNFTLYGNNTFNITDKRPSDPRLVQDTKKWVQTISKTFQNIDKRICKEKNTDIVTARLKTKKAPLMDTPPNNSIRINYFQVKREHDKIVNTRPLDN